jgi:hypothetical protein
MKLLKNSSNTESVHNKRLNILRDLVEHHRQKYHQQDAPEISMKHTMHFSVNSMNWKLILAYMNILEKVKK